MTKREFFEKVIATVEDTEMVEFAKAEIHKIDVANAKRSEKRAEKKAENEPLKAKIVEIVGEKTLASEIAEKTELSTSKVSYLCKELVNEGKLIVEDVKVKGKGVRKAYSLA